jgi:uncharacterized protein YqfA (UPF0365 family)
MRSSTILILIQLILSTLLLIIFIVVIWKFGWLWILAQLNGTPISLLKLMNMRVRRVDVAKVVRTAVLLKRAGIKVDPLKLEAHCLANGNVDAIAEALIIAHRGGHETNIDQICSLDLSGIDVCAEVRKAIAHSSGPHAP